MTTEIITGQAMATAADITIRIIRATPSKFTIRPAIPMGIAGLTIAAGIDTYIAAAIADIIITTGKTSCRPKRRRPSHSLCGREFRLQYRAREPSEPI